MAFAAPVEVGIIDIVVFLIVVSRLFLIISLKLLAGMIMKWAIQTA